MKRRKLQVPDRLDLVAPVEIQAAESGDGDKKVATFSIRAYTGGVMQVHGFFDPVIVDLQGLKARGTQIPILNGHSHDRIVGHSTDVEVSDQGVSVRGVVSGVGFYANEVVESAKNGFPWQASIGASVDRALFLEEGETMVINGQTVKGPLVVAKKTRLNEVSFVPLGADPKTSAKVAAEAHGAQSDTIGVDTMKFEEFVASLGLDIDALSDTQRTALKAKFEDGATVQARGAQRQPKTRKSKGEAGRPTVEASAEGNQNSNDPLQMFRENAAVEAERISGIEALAKRSEFCQVENVGTLQATAIRENWSPDQFELACRRAGRPDPQSYSGRMTQEDLQSQAQVLECAVARQCGTFTDQDMQRLYDERTLTAADDKRYRGASVHMLLDAAIAATGGSYSGSRKSNEFIRTGLRADQELRANAGFSTVSVSQILENVANKQLIASYDAVEVTWPQICAVHPMSDFKVHSRYRLDSEGSFRVVPPSGEIKHVGLSDDKYQKQLDTYGAIIALNRQQIINDDLNAFLELPRILGRMAAVRLEEAVYTLLLSNPNNFFHANNSNLMTEVLGMDGITEAEETFLNQVDPNGKPILVSPKVLLVPTTLKVTADNLYADNTLDTMALDSNDAVAFARNPHKGKYPPKSSPYLNNTSITDQDGKALSGQSDTAWYLFADPRVRAAIAVGLLNGNRVPVLESDETDFNTLGMQWRAYHDFGVGVEDPKAAVKSTGAG
jgi:hypothetical protein